MIDIANIEEYRIVKLEISNFTRQFVNNKKEQDGLMHKKAMKKPFTDKAKEEVINE